MHAELGDVARARALLGELEPDRGPLIASVPTAFFAAAELGVGEEFRERTRSSPRDTPWDLAAEAVLDGRWLDAADAYDLIGARPFAALAALRAARELVEQGRRPEADVQLRRALAFYREVGATRYIRAGEDLLAASA